MQRAQEVGTDNDIRLVESKKTRDAALCMGVPSRRATGWVGTLKEVGTILGGDSGVVSV